MPQAPGALVFAARRVIVGLLASASLAVHAAEPPARVLTFSPQGAVPAAQQVRATFSEPMQPLGKLTAPGPFDVDCALAGDAHWVDDHTWVMDLKEQALSGQVCEFRIKPALRSLAGRAVDEPLAFRFELPVLTDEMKRKVVNVFPERDSDWVAEDQAFLLRYSLPLGSARPDVRCEVPGRDSVPVTRLPPEVRDAMKLTVWWGRSGDDFLEAVRCPFALTPESPLTLRLLRPGLKPDVMKFKVRPLPAVAVDCQRLPKSDDCAANFPITLRFNAAMPEALLREIRVEGEQGWRPGEVAVQAGGMYAGASSSVSFNAGFRARAEYRIRWPEQALADVSGRPLRRDRLPTRIRTLPVLGLAYFALPTVSIRPFHADNPVPVFLQGAGRAPSVRETLIGSGSGDDEAVDGEILRYMGVSHGGLGVSHYFSRTRSSDPSVPRLPSTARSVTLDIPAPTAPPAPQHGQVLLQGAGLHLLELQGFAGQGSVAPVYDSVAVLFTRLAVHLKVAEENSAVWVTQLDGGAPVAGVALNVYDCLGKLAWQGVSDAQGLASIARKSLGRCGYPDAGVTVVARHHWPDGERDISVANSRWDSVLDASSYGLHEAWGASAIQAHTVLDRSLFKPGETVSMRHVVRRETNTGLAQLRARDLPDEAKIVHRGSGKAWTVRLDWALPGDGTSRFELPQDAPLGNYAVMLQMDGPSHFDRKADVQTAQFAVEAFRLPAMLGEIQAPQPRLILGTAPTLKLALHFADGGAAQRWPVTLRVYAQFRGQRRPAALEGYPGSARFAADVNEEAPDEDSDQVLLDTQSLALDEQGQAPVTLPALRRRSEPYVLHAELSYQDPNGEAQTLSQDFDVQPSLLSVGVRTTGPVALRRPLQLRSLVVDETGLALASQPARISARRREGYGAVKVEELGEVCQGLTDAKGELVCSFVPAKPGQYQFEATAADAAGGVARAHSTIAYVAEQSLPAQPLFLNPDKVLYREGETAHLTVTSPFARSHVWLTLERQGILESRVITLDAAQTRIKLPIRPEWAGNVAVSMLALDASSGALATGITELMVSTEAHALKVSLKADRLRYQPGDIAQVRIHVARPGGKPLPTLRRLSFVAVDEALLSLKDNTSWELLAGMLRPHLHKVRTVSGLTMNPPVDEAGMLSSAESAVMDLIRLAAKRAAGLIDPPQFSVAAPAMAAKSETLGRFPDRDLESVVVTGMRAARSDDAPPPPARTLLDALLHWQADVPIDDQGNAVVSFPIKDALSRFRLVAVASAGDEDFGTGAAYLDVAKDLQITAGLPPQVRDGDRFAALVTVRNTSANAIALDATARLAGQAALPAQALRLAAGESRQLSWEVRVPTGAKALGWTFAAKERGGSHRQDVLAVTQQVEPAVPVTVQAATLAQVNGSFDAPAFGFDGAGAQAGTARVAVQLLPSLAGHLGGVQAWLAAYAYRCLEQTASRAVGMHDRPAWDAAMAELPRYLDGDGLAGYFPATPAQPAQGSDTLTAYLLDIADSSGWPIPAAERQRMLAGLEGFAAGRLKRSFWAPRDDSLARKLAAMATLARHGRLKQAQLEAVRIDPDEWTSAMLMDWLTILRKSGLQPGTQATQAMTENALRARLSYQGRRLVLSTESRDYWWWLMSHGDVDAARLLLTVADLPGWQADLPRLLTGLLSRQQSNGAWATTNANAWGALAVDAFAKLMEPVAVAGATRITLGQHQQTVDWSTPGRRSFDASLSQGTDALHIQHQGPGAPWASVEVRAAVPLTAPRFAGYSLSRSITPVQQKVAGQWHVGDVLRVRLSIRAQADMSWVVVNDPVPAGASILGAGLGRDSAAAQAGEQRSGNAWPLYQARDFTAFKSFYRHVPRGDFSLEYTIRLNNPGQFALPPTRVEAMYAPEVFGEAPNAVVVIEP